MRYASKYPKDVYTAMTSTKTFSVRGELFPCSAFADDPKDASSPYKVYNETFSRFIFTVINKSPDGKKTYPSGNISVNEIPDIIRASETAKTIESMLSIPLFSMLYGIMEETNSSTEKIICGLQNLFYFVKNGKLKPKKDGAKQQELPSGDKARNVVIRLGPPQVKGKTPWAALAEDPANKERLLTHAEFLKKNLGKYPKNQEEIDAINEAVVLFDHGKLANESGEPVVPTSRKNITSGTIKLYGATPRTLIRKADENGFCPVYEISAEWHLGDNFPVEFTVKNYRAPYRRNENGTINPDRSKATDIVSNNFRLTSAQWFDCLYKIRTHMRRFEDIWAKKQFDEAETADRFNRTNANAG